MNKITNLGNIAQCIYPGEETHCSLVKEERTQDYSVKVYNCFGLDLEEELSLLLDDTDNYQTKNIIAVVGNNTIGLARRYYSSSLEESEEDYTFSDEY